MAHVTIFATNIVVAPMMCTHFNCPFFDLLNEQLACSILRHHDFVSMSAKGQVQRFTSQPQDSVVNKGQLVILNCSVHNLVGNVQWLRDGFGLGPGPVFDGYPRYRVDNDSSTGKIVTMNLTKKNYCVAQFRLQRNLLVATLESML